MLFLTLLLLFASVPVDSDIKDFYNGTISNSSTYAMRDVNIQISPYENMDGIDSNEYNYYDDEDTDCFTDLHRCIYASPQSYPVCAYDVREERYIDFFDLCEIEFRNCEDAYRSEGPNKPDGPRFLLTGDGYLCLPYLGTIATPLSRKAGDIYNPLFDEQYKITNLKPDLKITDLLRHHYKSPIFTDSTLLRKLINSTTNSILTNDDEIMIIVKDS